MRQRKVVVFWTDDNRRTWISSELSAGRLRQGWGIPGSELTENGDLISFTKWAERFAPSAKNAWGGNPDANWMKNRYGILCRMVALREGDLAVVPRMPDTDEFTIARVTQGYVFDDRHFHTPPQTMVGVKDYGHVVRVDPKGLVTFGYGASPEARSIAAKFRRYRSAVNNVRDDQYANTICNLFDRGSLLNSV